jgi:uncharacterized protein (TIGR02466 family)|tara:strand:+ start:58 stop:705 length:648 start_codon:yes stop_codon:yes gene_type:complete
MTVLFDVTDNISYIFPTPIYKNEVGNYDQIKLEFDQALDKINFTYKEAWGHTHYLSDPTFFENAVNTYNLIHFKKELHKHIIEYSKHVTNNTLEFDEDDYYIESSWFTKFNKGNYGHIHSHGQADIAGVFYIKNPLTKESGCLFFNTPVNPLDDSFLFNLYGARLEANIPPGGLILFPGFLKHGVTTNITDEERISFSFNIMFDKRRLGEKRNER